MISLQKPPLYYKFWRYICIYRFFFVPLRADIIVCSPTTEWRHQPQLGVEERVVTTEKTTEKSTEAIILLAMRSNPYITQKELAAKCGLTEDGVYYVVSKLRKSGVVKRVGGRKLGRWEVLV